MQTLYMIDANILAFIHAHLQIPALDAFFPVFTRLGDHGMIWLLLAACLLLSKKHRRTGACLILALALCALAGNLVLKPILARARPFGLFPDHTYLIAPPGDFSFPSGHTAAAFTVAAVLSSSGKKPAAAAFIFAVLMGLSRLYLLVHYPSDVICGALLGLLIGAFSKKLLKHAEMGPDRSA